MARFGRICQALLGLAYLIALTLTRDAKSPLGMAVLLTVATLAHLGALEILIRKTREVPRRGGDRSKE